MSDILLNAFDVLSHLVLLGTVGNISYCRGGERAGVHKAYMTCLTLVSK